MAYFEILEDFYTTIQSFRDVLDLYFEMILNQNKK